MMLRFNRVAHSLAAISLIAGTWHAIGYFCGATPNVTEMSPGSWQHLA